MDEPQRIVSLISSATEILFGIGAGPRVLAVSHECDFPAAVRGLPKATRSLIDSSRTSDEIDRQVSALSSSGAALYELDAELIRELRPDLIVTQAQCDVCAVRYADVVDLVRTSPGLASTNVVALSPTSLSEVLADVTRIGEAAGHSTAAAAFAQSLQRRIDRLSRKTARLSAKDRPRVACIEWVEPLMFAANWTPELIELAGGNPGLATAGNHSSYSQWEDLVQYDPEVLLISPCGFDLNRSIQEARRWKSKPGWESIAAVKDVRTWVIDGNAYLNRSGPRLVDSLEILAHLIQPQMFERPSWSDPADLPWAKFL